MSTEHRAFHIPLHIIYSISLFVPWVCVLSVSIFRFSAMAFYAEMRCLLPRYLSAVVWIWDGSRSMNCSKTVFSVTIRRMGCRQGQNQYYHIISFGRKSFHLRFVSFYISYSIQAWNELIFFLFENFFTFKFIWIFVCQNLWQSIGWTIESFVKETKDSVHKLTINYNACYWIKVITSYTWTIFNAFISFFLSLRVIPSTLDYVNFRKIQPSHGFVS